MTYEWTFEDLTIYKEHEGQVDVVSGIPWTLTATDGDHSASDFSTVVVQYQAGDPFIAFADLTKANIEGWVEEALDVDAIKSRLDARVAEQQSPTTENLPTPWSDGN
jgi:hypothetical protein